MQLLCAGFLGRENYVSMWAKKITGDMPTFVIGLSSISRGLDVTLVSVTAACTNIQPSTVSWQCVWKYARESFFDVIHRQWRPWPCRRPSSPPPIYII